MKKIIILSLLAHQVFADSNISISNIIVGPQYGEKKTFSITATLDNQGHTIESWQIGFYMPRNFRTTAKSNKNLSMQICEESSTTKCSQLLYQKPAFDKPDLSTAFTTILKPKLNFPITTKQRYTIKLLQNSSQSSANISSLPQSFFIINNDKLILLPTDLKTYTVLNYNESAIQQKITKYIASKSDNGFKHIINVVPYPQSVMITDATKVFNLDNKIILHNNANLSDNQLQFWIDAFNTDFNRSLKIDTDQKTTGIILKYADVKDPEGYTIAINSDNITVTAKNPAGFFYALQTLRQLWFKQASIPNLIITDSPRFKYRGVQIDVARHFFTVDELKNFIDILAANKLNTLHLHLSDDEAFRIELDGYPELTKIGTNRGIGKMIGPMSMIQNNLFSVTKDINNTHEQLTNYSGSYSKNDIQELIKYANQRQITVIPEIDIPGHSRALMKSMPNAFYDPTDVSEYTGHGDNALPICAYNNSSEFGKRFTNTLEDILTKTSNLFTNQSTLYAIQGELGIGGDEVSKNTWSKSPLCNGTNPWKKMDELNKEHYFLDLLNNHNDIKNIPLSGWQEFVLNHDGTIDKNGVKPNEIGHVWVWEAYKKSANNAITLANNDYPVVLSYADSLYFDMTYTPDFKEPGFFWATNFGDTYAALNSSILASQTANKSNKPKNIIGLEAGIWTDVIEDYSQLIYMTAPKITGLSEAAWSAESITNIYNKTNWNSLSKRLGCEKDGFLSYLYQKHDVKYRGYPNGIQLENPSICK